MADIIQGVFGWVEADENVIVDCEERGVHPDPLHLQHIAQLALERDESCVICGRKKDLVVHHRTEMYHRWGAELVGDVSMVCRGVCHAKIHGKYDWSKEKRRAA